MEDKTLLIFGNKLFRGIDETNSFEQLREEIIQILNHFIDRERADFLEKEQPEDHIFKTMLSLRQKCDFLEPVSRELYVFNGDEICKNCNQLTVPAYVSYDYLRNPRHVIPHVIYGNCRNCGQDQRHESF